MLTTIGFFDTFAMPKTKCFDFVESRPRKRSGTGTGTQATDHGLTAVGPMDRRINGP